MKRAGLLALIALSGCNVLEDFEDKLSGVTNPVVIEGVYLGIAVPESDLIDLSTTEFDAGATAQVFLASASNADDLEDAPISGATVIVGSATNGDSTLVEIEDGVYSGTSEDGLAYDDFDTITVVATQEDSAHKVTIELPEAAEVASPTPESDGYIQHAIDEDLTIEINEDQEFDSLLVVVMDIEAGEVTYSNQPETISDYYDFSHGEAQSGLSVVVPGSAFPDQTLYAVGVAGLQTAGSSDFEDVNTVLSTFMAGKMAFYPTSTIEIPDL